MCIAEDDEMEVHTMWDKVGELKAAKNRTHGPSHATPKVFLAVVSSDSSISYYLVDQRSLSLEELPRKS